jgi:hypothetical protein
MFGCFPSTNSTVLASTNASAGTLTFAWLASGTAGVRKGAAFAELVDAARTTINGMVFSINMAGETAAEMGAELECVNLAARWRREERVSAGARWLVSSRTRTHTHTHTHTHRYSDATDDQSDGDEDAGAIPTAERIKSILVTWPHVSETILLVALSVVKWQRRSRRYAVFSLVLLFPSPVPLPSSRMGLRTWGRAVSVRA